MGKKWTEKEIEKLIKLSDNGYTNKEIAELLSRTPKAIKVKLSVIGYKRPNEYTKILKEKIGRLTILEYSENKKKYLCYCECGNTKWINAGHVKSGKTKSCGCLYREYIEKSRVEHDNNYLSMRDRYYGMVARCNNKNHKAYKNYGGRGIYVSKEWDTFEKFYKDMGNPPFKDASVDRIDNDGPYSPLNCKWSTRSQQAINKRNNNNMFGITQVKSGKYYLSIQRELVERNSIHTYDVEYLFKLREKWIAEYNETPELWSENTDKYHKYKKTIKK